MRRTKGNSYSILCALAEAWTFCDVELPTGRAAQLKEEAERLFRQTLADAHTRGEVARIAAIWIDSTHRRHGGIFLSGTFSGGEIAGDVYEYHFSTEDGSGLVVLVPQPLDYRLTSAGQKVAIVGAIVEKPADKITGYTGTTPRAIWASHVIPLE